MKKFILGIVMVLGLLVIPKNVLAKEDIIIYLFRGSSCTHCEAALNYLNEHKEEIPEGVKFVTYEVQEKTTSSKNNSKLLEKMDNKFGLTGDDFGSFPLFVVGDSYQLGYSDATDIKKLYTLAEKYKIGEKEYKDIVAEEIKNSKLKVKSMTLEDIFPEPNKVVTIIVCCVFGAIVLGFGAMIIFSRKN